MSINIYAGGVIAPQKETIQNSTNPFIKTVNGYIRGGYQLHILKNDKRYEDSAIGGKLHMLTQSYYGISLAGSFYTSNALGSSENRGLIPFRGELEDSYTILSEAYLQVEFGKTSIKLGRQEIETPFAQIDDIGMVPNTFEAYIIENRDIEDTTLFLGQIQKMAGVDADIVDKFTPINGNENIQVLGVTYEGLENLMITAWYYHMKSAKVDNISYIEAIYEKDNFLLGAQYAHQSYTTGQDTSVYGVSASISFKRLGLTISAAYNSIDGNAAFSGFGGGPFFSNSEYLIPDNAGEDGSQSNIGLEWDASSIGAYKLSFSLYHATLQDKTNRQATETDLVVAYELNTNIEAHLIASHINAIKLGEDDANHMRLFVNYIF
jgi:hypothetical protein